MVAEKSANIVFVSQIAEQIAMDVQGATYKVTPYPCENPNYIRKCVRDLIKDQPWKDRVVLAVDGKVLFVRIKEVSRLKRMEQLLESALCEIENEHLYDEIYEVLYGGKSGN